MPELPEVQTFGEYISAHCLHSPIIDVQVLDTRIVKKISSATFKRNILKNSFDKVTRKGKYLIISLSSGKDLIFHFGLTGFLDITKPNEVIRFTVILFTFKKKISLHFCDVRKFAKVWLVDDARTFKELADLGIDPLHISARSFMALAEKYPKKNVKAFLMDQSLIAGIGNEYSDEILFQAGIDPHHKMADLSEARIKKIYNQMRRVLRYATKVREKSMQKFAGHRLFNAGDSSIFTSSYLQAHRHTDGKCPKNSTHKLKKVTIAGRSTYYCPIDQK